jgi:small subunit ribosomal protein S20
MANHASAKKRARRNEKRADMNKSRRSRIRTFLKKVEAAISAKDSGEAKEALRLAQPELQKGIAKGILHKNTVARKLSRLSARVKAI